MREMRQMYRDEELRGIYRDWKGSGLSQTAYCKKHGIERGTFKDDLYQLRKRDRSKNERVGEFNQVRMVEEGRRGEGEAYCEVRFSGGHIVSFSDKASVAGLKTLIRELIQAT